MKYALIGAARVVAAASVTPALAATGYRRPRLLRAVLPECKCQNLGPGNPYTDGGYYRNGWQNGYRPAASCPTSTSLYGASRIMMKAASPSLWIRKT